MRGRQQFEVPQVRRQHQQPVPRVTLLQFLPVVETVVVGDPLLQPSVEEPAQTYVLGGAAAEIDVRPAKDSPPLPLVPFGKRDSEVAHPDSSAPAVDQIAHITAHNPERVQDEVGEQA